jgi:hypothetical protein
LPKLEQVELERYRHRIVEDVKSLIERYRAIFDWDIPDIDQTLADRLILAEIRTSVDEVERELQARARSETG